MARPPSACSLLWSISCAPPEPPVVLYLTYNDQPSGVYWSQVTDVVEHLNTLGGDRVRLVALVSMRGYALSRHSIQARSPGAIVLPMVPRAINWRVNWIWLYLVCLLLRPSGIIGRGIFATGLALRMRNMGRVVKVCFDARAAYAAEWEEFRVMDDDRLIAATSHVEELAVKRSDVRLSVSEALVEHWRTRFGYTGTRQVVIPCTLGSALLAQHGESPADVRGRFGWNEQDVVLVYSGTVVGWQSLELMHDRLGPWLKQDPGHRLLFLSGSHPCIVSLQARFPQQVAQVWVEHHEVRSMLLACDHGLLLRDPCITNRVASPTKFAEYLSAGLPVVISEGVGDLSGMVRQHGLGMVLDHAFTLELTKPDGARRKRMTTFAEQHFSKPAFQEEYGTLLLHMRRAYAEWSSVEPDPEPLVTVIVPSHNKCAFIGDMVRSVQEQTDGRWELLVIDDASSDGSPELLQQLAQADPRIRLTVLPKNKGANHCRNLGIAHARGAYIILLDADDLLARHCLKHRLKYMKGSGMDLMVFTMEVFEEKPGDNDDRWVPDSDAPLLDFFRHKLPWQTMQPIWDRNFLSALGGFDEGFSRHQDVELHTRALLSPGVQYRLFPGEPDCYYRIAEERKAVDPARLLMRFSRSAMMYHEKFKADAERIRNADLLLGIIHRTYLQVLLHRKAGRIDEPTLLELEAVLLAPDWFARLSADKRMLLRLTRWYNLMPVRLPGVNRLIYTMLTKP